MAASSICALHCALAPVLVTVASLIGLGYFFEEKFETNFIMATLGLAFISFAWAFYKNHQQLKPIYLLLFGGSLFYIAHIDSVTTHLPESVLMALGGLSISVSHFINLKLCRQYRQSDDRD